MTQYDNTNSGVLFREREKKSEKAPDMRGKLNVDGKEYELAGWTRESKNGVKFLSLKIQEPREKQEKPKAAPVYNGSDEPNDEIPFAWAFAVPIAGLIAVAIYAQNLGMIA